MEPDKRAGRGPVALAVHGGAGQFSHARQPAARAGCLRVVKALRTPLREGASALELVETAVRMLEDDPCFNAGTGSAPNERNEVEMDAIISCGNTLRFGAVAAIENVANPVCVARRLLDAGGDPALLAGVGASAFARQCGFPHVASDRLRGAETELSVHGTVGAVALDAAGRVAAATSTGGIRGKRRGRVGDSPLIGCGALADDALGAASATGHGEALMRIQMARTVLEALRSGADAGRAAQRAVAILGERVAGEGGVICVDRAGGVGFAHNTAQMAACTLNALGEHRVYLEPSDSQGAHPERGSSAERAGGAEPGEDPEPNAS